MDTEKNTPSLGSTNAWIIWSLAVIFVIWLFNIQTGYAILNPSISKDLNLSVSQVGMIGATYTWVFAIAQLFSGALLDKLGARKVLIPAIILTGVGIFLMGNAQSFSMLLLSQFILALGSCAGFVGAGYVGGVWFGMAKFGFMFGLVQVVAALSSAFGGAAFDFALKSLTWRDLMNGFGFFGIILVVLAFIFIKNPTPIKSERLTIVKFSGSVIHSIFEVLKNLQVVLVAIQGAIIFGIMLALAVIWAPKIMEAHGITGSAANYASPALWLGLAVGSIFINKWTDKVKSRKQPVIITTIIQLVSLASALYLPINATMGQLLFFIFGAANAGHMLAFTIAGDNVPIRQIGTSASIVNGSMFVIGGFLMSTFGKYLDGTKETPDAPLALENFQSGGLILMIIPLVLATVIAFIIKESYGSHNE